MSKVVIEADRSFIVPSTDEGQSFAKELKDEKNFNKDNDIFATINIEKLIDNLATIIGAKALKAAYDAKDKTEIIDDTTRLILDIKTIEKEVGKEPFKIKIKQTKKEKKVVEDIDTQPIFDYLEENSPQETKETNIESQDAIQASKDSSFHQKAKTSTGKGQIGQKAKVIQENSNNNQKIEEEGRLDEEMYFD